MRWNFEAFEWNLLVALTLVGGALIALANPANAAEPVDDPEPVAEATDLPPAIRAIQDSLGGPLADRYNEMRDGEAEIAARPWWKRFRQSRLALVAPATAEAAVMGPQLKVSALRDEAVQLDDSANRLESLDLYQQADALREVAQRLRVDARRMVGGPATAGDVAPMPASGVSPYGGTVLPASPARPRRFVDPPSILMPSPVPTPAPIYPQDDGDADSDDGDDPTPVPTPARAE